jgi:hypothetical protein
MPRRLSSAGSRVPVFLLVLMALAGCGSSPAGNGVAAKSPSEIVAAAKAAADAARSVHVAGSIVSSGSPITLDLNLLASRGGYGQLSENALSFEVIHVGGTVYIKGSPAFYRHVGGPAAAELLQGRWLKAPATVGSFASLASLTDLHQLVDMTLTIRGTLVRAGTATVNGQKVVGVTDTSHGGTLYVATTGPPYPVEVAENGKTGGKIVFDRWSKPVSLTAPANAVDITQLQAGH